MWFAELHDSIALILHLMARALPKLGTLSLQSTTLLVGMSGVVRLCRHRSASLRYQLWSATFAGILILPVLTQWGPTWHVPVVLPGRIWLQSFDQRETTSPIVSQHSAPTIPAVPNHGDATVSRTSIPPAPMTNTTTGVTAPVPDHPTLTPWAWIMVVWAVGVLVMVIRIVTGLFGVRHLAREAVPLIDGTWLQLISRSTERLGIRRPVTLLLSEHHVVPLTWGITHPKILLPASALGWSEEQCSAVVMHELAHVRRFDALVQIVVQISTTGFWFNPWVWTAARHMQLECERACDDLVLSTGISPISYASHLVHVARTARLGVDTSHMAWWSLAMARPTGLETRIRSILNPTVNRRSLRTRGVAMLTLMISLTTVSIAALRPAAAAVPRETLRVVTASASAIQRGMLAAWPPQHREAVSEAARPARSGEKGHFAVDQGWPKAVLTPNDSDSVRIKRDFDQPQCMIVVKNASDTLMWCWMKDSVTPKTKDEIKISNDHREIVMRIAEARANGFGIDTNKTRREFEKLLDSSPRQRQEIQLQLQKLIWTPQQRQEIQLQLQTPIWTNLPNFLGNFR